VLNNGDIYLSLQAILKPDIIRCIMQV